MNAADPVTKTQLQAQSLELLVQQWADWVTVNFLAISIAVGAGAVLVAILLGVRSLGKRICDRAPNQSWAVVFGRAIARTRLWFIVSLAAMLVDGYTAPPPAVADTIHFLFTIAATLQGALWVRELILGSVEHRAGGRNDAGTLGSAMQLIRALVTFAIFAIALILILDNLGVNVTGLVAGLGIGGIAIGLAAQGIFSDLFAALAIIFDRPFRVGDTIKWGTATGTVEAVGMKTVRVRSVDGEEIIISNSKLLGDLIRNMGYIRHRRVLLALNLHYRNDPAVIATAADEIKAIVAAEQHCVFVHAVINDLAPNAVVMEVLFNIDTGEGEVMNKARHNVITRLLKRFDELGLEFSYQAQDVEVKAVNVTITPAER